MRYTDILAKFLGIFPDYQSKIRLWSPNGHHSIEVETYSRQNLEFVYQDDKNWSLTSYTGKRAERRG